MVRRAAQKYRADPAEHAAAERFLTSEAAEIAIERAFGGGSGEPAGTGTSEAPAGAAPGAAEPEDDQKSLERALREQMGEPGKDAPKQ